MLGAEMSSLGVVAGLLLVAFLPGFLLVEAAFPRGPPTGGRPGSRASLTLLLSVILSLALTTLVGLVLGFLPGGGAFSGRVTGAPNLEIALAALSLLLSVLAYARGAFPRIAGLVGWTPPLPDVGPHDPPTRRPTLEALVEARRGETELTLRILAVRLRTLWPQPASTRRHRQRSLDRLREARDEVRDEARQLERELAQARFGGSP
jgi:hypothetical protein